mgnify:CR=1 FL=1
MLLGTIYLWYIEYNIIQPLTMVINYLFNFPDVAHESQYKEEAKRRKKRRVGTMNVSQNNYHNLHMMDINVKYLHFSYFITTRMDVVVKFYFSTFRDLH